MDRARRAEPYSNATIWTREIARNLAGHLARISKAHSCVDTKSPKTRLLPKFQHGSKRCATSPVKARQHHLQQSPEQQLHPSPVKEGDEDGHGPEQRGDDEEDGDASPHSSQTTRNEDGSEVKIMRRQRKSPKKKARAASKKTRMEADRLEMIAHENQRMQERLAKIATPSGKQHQQQPRTSSAHHAQSHSQSSDDSMWDSPEMPPSRTPHDYNKKQEQLKIWTENQALAKRLRTAKGTLNCKEWEKDDKWNQHFLKSQEKRRIALQHELLKAQMSPLAASVMRVTKLNQHESSPGTRSPSTAASVSMANSQGDHVEENSSNARATAANHRRIMMLRKQRSAPSKERHGAAAKQLGNQFEAGSLLTSESRESDADVVNVRFTFSRERRPDPASGGADALTIDPATYFGSGGRRDNLFALGAFSPAVELESALDALEMGPAESKALLSPELDDGADADGVAEATDIDEVLNTPQSPLEQSNGFTDEEINAVVFDTLQDSIDLIADALSDETGTENPSNAQVDDDECDHRLPAEDGTDQSVPVPLTEATPAEVASTDNSAIDSGTTPDSAQSASAAETPTHNASEGQIGTDDNSNVEAPDVTQAAEPNCERIPHGEEPGEGDQNSAPVVAETVDALEEASTQQEGAIVGDMVEPHDPQVTSAVELAPIESSNDAGNDEQETQDPEYDEENFDDDAPPHPLPEVTADPVVENKILSDDASPVETTSAADAGDEASGYGSEFDEDQDQHDAHEQQQQQEEALNSVEKESADEAQNGDYEDEHYDDQYDEGEEEEEEAVGAQSEVNTSKHDEHRQNEEELSYSDDGFSEGEDT